MDIINTYSLKNGEEFIKNNHPNELNDIIYAIKSVNAVTCLSKESEEKTKKGKLLFSPANLNNEIKLILHKKGWTAKSNHGKKPYKEPRHSFGRGQFREMDGIKNMVGLEIQFGKYSFMVYDIFSKMIIFKKLGYIDCGIEVVPSKELAKNMSSGVSYFEQLIVDIENRGNSNIDIPVYIIGIGQTSKEKEKTIKLQQLFYSNREKAITSVHIRKYKGSRPGPK